MGDRATPMPPGASGDRPQSPWLRVSCLSYLLHQRGRVEDDDPVLAAAPQLPRHRHHLRDGAPRGAQGQRFGVLGVPEATCKDSGKRGGFIKHQIPSLSWLGGKRWLETSLWDADGFPFIGQVMSLGGHSGQGPCAVNLGLHPSRDSPPWGHSGAAGTQSIPCLDPTAPTQPHLPPAGTR